MENNFRTQKGYALNNKKTITYAMEDYLEMIYRLSRDSGFLRLTKLACKLNVKPSSASKMMQSLKNDNLIEYEKYGIIILTEEGMKLGKYLLQRHNVLKKFFSILNGTEDVLKEIEQIEHFLNKDTVKNISKLVEYLIENNYVLN